MSIFELHKRVLEDYRDFIASFVDVQDKRLQRYVEEEVLKQGKGLMPEPLLQLSPAYRMGQDVDSLAEEGLLHQETARIFRRPDGAPLRLYHHQVEAIRRAQKGLSYVLTSGTGSGKSFAYFIPIVDAVVRYPGVRGPMALVVYPMNALVNSQLKALEDLKKAYEERYQRPFPLRFARYTGQTPEEERRALREDPPHLLLTNYVMGEYLLTRPEDQPLVLPPLSEAPFFLVFDELHTYRGRQGADVALLVRRLRARLPEGRPVVHVGTSATLVARRGATQRERKEAVARFASTFFGTAITPENVVEEVLEPATQGGPPSGEELRKVLGEPLPQDPQAFRKHPLARFAEWELGLERDGEGGFRRRPPRTLGEVAEVLAKGAGIPQEEALTRLQEVLALGARLQEGGRPLFAFKLHQFISQTFPIYASLEDPESREFGQEPYAPSGKLLYPLYFCRSCGQEYYRVRLEEGRFLPAPVDYSGEEEGVFYLAWVEDFNPEEDLPESWFDRSGKLRKEWKARRPKLCYVTPEGQPSEVPSPGHYPFYAQPHPFSLCLRCGADWTAREAEFTKLTYLGSEGRTSATTILATALLRTSGQVLGKGRDKLLSFTDNRQDASLQAGHFNDFVRTTLLRAALYRALKEKGRLTHNDLAQEVRRRIPLPLSAVTRDPALREGTPAANRTYEVLEDLIRYRLYADLRRAWRFTQPTLEEVGLLEVAYPYVEVPEFLQEARELFARHGAKLEEKEVGEAVRGFLDHLRRNLALAAKVLKEESWGRLVRETGEHLNEYWAIDPETESPVLARGFALGSTDKENVVRFTRRGRAGRDFERRFGVRLTEDFLRELVDLLRGHGLLREEGGLYWIPESALEWWLGDGTPRLDPARLRGDHPRKANPYFARLYQEGAGLLERLEAREHTAQVRGEERERRERRFRGEEEPRLPYLVASPTLELGVDIADLDIVHLRNLPPTPANYAQRVGRAGRQGQPGLVIAFAGAFSAHDRYFFHHRQEMVAGSVRPPSLDLQNEALLRSHIHAEWLARTGVALRDSMVSVLDLDKEGYPLWAEVQKQIRLSEEAKENLLAHLKRVFQADWAELTRAPWFSEAWLRRVVDEAPTRFDRAFDIWRDLYQAASEQQRLGNQMASNWRSSPEERKRGEKIREEAEQQIRLLLQEGVAKEEGDFYPYRYLASEEFLPGYNLMALSVRAFVPRGEGEYVSRPRQLAITEMAPGSILYHEGGKWTPARLIIPPGGLRARHRHLRLCRRCGGAAQEEHSTCPSCQVVFDGTNSELHPVLDLVGVVMRRRERITANEEERLRSAYQVKLGFELHHTRRAHVEAAGKEFSLVYGPGARLHYLNLGLRRKEPGGFLVNLETGELERPDSAKGRKERNPRPGESTERAALHVAATQNILLLEVWPLLGDSFGEELVWSLGYALKRGMERLFQVEESELGLELVGQGEKMAFLFYERVEGSLGVLRRLVEEEGKLGEVAQQALDVLHFSPEGKDLKKECARACHECLLSYNNQRQSHLLNRHLVKDVLLELSEARVHPVEREKDEERLEYLSSMCQSELERRFLQFLKERGLPLPDEAQYRVSQAHTVADFFYRPNVLVYIDGPHHQTPSQQRIDQHQRDHLLDLGYRVVVLRGEEDWEEKVRGLVDSPSWSTP